MRRLVPLFTILLLPLLLTAPALGATRLGSDASETLVGTNKADRITGGGGDDTLEGLADNDTYYFKDGWGNDTLEDLATYKVGGKKKPGGTDTLSFRGVTNGHVIVVLIPEFGPDFNFVNGGNGEHIALGDSVVENVVGTQEDFDSDSLQGGGGANVLDSGGGGGDNLLDFGGEKEQGPDRPELPASSDIYKGVAANTGFVAILDYGGSKDVLDLRPLASDQVYLEAVNCDSDPERECLQIVTGNGNGQVVVRGQFGEYSNFTTEQGQDGRIELLRFSDDDVRLDDDVTVSAAALRTGSPTGNPLTKRQQREAERAPALLEDALRELETRPAPGTLPSR